MTEPAAPEPVAPKPVSPAAAASRAAATAPAGDGSAAPAPRPARPRLTGHRPTRPSAADAAADASAAAPRHPTPTGRNATTSHEARHRATKADTTPAATAGSAAPAPGGIGAGYLVGRFFLRPLVHLLYRPRVHGRDNVPRTGPLIFASNHLSFIDSIAIPMTAPRAVRFLAKATYFEGKGARGWLSRTFFTSVGASPVRRGAGQAALEALEQQKQLLEDDQAIALYPEGTRSLDGRLYKGRTGVAFLALQTGALVVPVGLTGTNVIMPVGARFPRLRPRITVRFGTPIDVGGHGPATSGRARRLATDEIMAAIHELSGQELAGTYNEVPAQTPIERIKQALPHERR